MVMRAWTIPIFGAVTLSLAVPAPADARPRFGPAAVLGVFTGVLGGFRPSFGHHRRSVARPSNDQRGDDTPRAERRLAASANLERTEPDQVGPVFWPSASADIVEYAFFPKGKDDRFWAYGIGAIVDGAFTTADADGARVLQARASFRKEDLLRKEDLANKDGATALAAKEPDSSAGTCSNEGKATADGLIERIEQAIQPRDAQRDVLERLRTAVTEVAERINAACPAATPANPAQRLKAIEDRIWAMRNALLTLRLPFERFYQSLTQEQQSRLHGRDDLDIGARAADGRDRMCGEPAAAAGMADGPARVIERAVRPTQQQRASLEALRLRSAGMAQLIMSSCRAYPLSGHMGRFAAITDRLDVMLFAAMTVSPALLEFYDSLNDKQRTNLERTIRQLRRSARTGNNS
jgi:LTXXQ motif family protein